MRLNLQYNRSAFSTIYIEKIEGHDNDLLAKQILARGDKQEKKTNVKADMTEWRVNESEWYNLCRDIIDNHIIFLSGEIDVTWKIASLWGANYRKGDYTVYHSHMPCSISFCYYPKADKDSAPLVFSELDYELYPEEGQLVIFPSHLKHGVPSQREDVVRMVIAGNIVAEYD
jgi:hypothetical protein